MCTCLVAAQELYVLGSSSPEGGTCQSPALPALVRPPAPPLQPSLDIKPFLPFPLDTAAAVNLFPNFNADICGWGWSALAAVGFEGTCMQRWGQGLGCFCSSHGRSGRVTTVILVPVFSESAPMDLRQRLCEHGT
ncbi:hypothetical protein CB1_002077002 [Camelus ferus]|nr:hypothetical protein CB1_002077002 [Camelus ferus]